MCWPAGWLLQQRQLGGCLLLAMCVDHRLRVGPKQLPPSPDCSQEYEEDEDEDDDEEEDDDDEEEEEEEEGALHQGLAGSRLAPGMEC